MQEWLTEIAIHHEYLVYIVVIILGLLEGPFLSLFGGVLLNLGYFKFIPLYVALMVGDLLGDILWYYLGRHYGHRFIARFGKYFNITEASVEKVEKIFHSHKHKILFISKATNGFGFALATLFTAGMVKIHFGRFFAINVIGQFIWTGVLMSIGYFFGRLYIVIDTIIGRISFIALFVILAYALLQYKRYLEKRTQQKLL